MSNHFAWIDTPGRVPPTLQLSRSGPWSTLVAAAANLGVQAAPDRTHRTATIGSGSRPGRRAAVNFLDAELSAELSTFAHANALVSSDVQPSPGRVTTLYSLSSAWPGWLQQGRRADGPLRTADEVIGSSCGGAGSAVNVMMLRRARNQGRIKQCRSVLHTQVPILDVKDVKR